MGKVRRYGARYQRKVWIREYLAQALGLSLDSISYRLGKRGGYSAASVKQWLVEHGYVAPKPGEHAKKRAA